MSHNDHRFRSLVPRRGNDVFGAETLSFRRDLQVAACAVATFACDVIEPSVTDYFERATESVVDDMPHGHHPFKRSYSRGLYPGEDLSVLRKDYVLGAVGCAERSFRGIAFYKVPLHAFADALRPGTPRRCRPGVPPLRAWTKVHAPLRTAVRPCSGPFWVRP